jgi:hypothetical protein
MDFKKEKRPILRQAVTINILTPWNEVFEKLPAAQLVMKFPTF